MFLFQHEKTYLFMCTFEVNCVCSLEARHMYKANKLLHYIEVY